MIGAFRYGHCFPASRFPQAFAGFSCVVRLDVFLLWTSTVRKHHFSKVESNVNCLFHFLCVPMASSVNKFGFVP